LGHGHSHYVEDNHQHNEEVEGLVGHEFKDGPTVLAFRFIKFRRVDIRVVDQFLDLNPLFLFFIQKLVLLLLLGNMEVHRHDSDKQVDAENTAHHDKAHEHVDHVIVIVVDRTRGSACTVDVLEKVVRPSFQSGNHKEGYHTG
jgi:hypothetical protein